MIGYECVRSKSSTTTAFVARGTCATSEFIYPNEDGVCTNASGSESCDRNPVASECFICSWIESIHSTIFMDEATTTSMLIPERVLKHFWHQASHKFSTHRLGPNHLLVLVSSAFLVVSSIKIYSGLSKIMFESTSVSRTSRSSVTMSQQLNNVSPFGSPIDIHTVR